MITVFLASSVFHGVCFIPVAVSLLPEDSLMLDREVEDKKVSLATRWD